MEVSGITIQNSPQCHLKFDNCIDVEVHDMSVSSPGDSPNTDGIHLQNSRDVLIHSTTLACGMNLEFLNHNFLSLEFLNNMNVRLMVYLRVCVCVQEMIVSPSKQVARMYSYTT